MNNSQFRGLDDLFGDIGEERGQNIVNVKLVDIDFFPQRTRMYSDEDMEALTEDIAEHGVLEPVIVRPMPADETHTYDWYQVLNGRNRVTASRLAGKEDVPAIIREADDDIAAYIVATTTLNQRHTLLPSEKAFAYQMQLEAMKRRAGRPTKLNGSQVETNLIGQRSGDILAEKVGDSKAKVYRYISLTRLIPPLLQLVDEGALSLGAGGAISFLSPEEQETIDAFMREHSVQFTLEQAEHLKKYSQDIGQISYLQLRKMFSSERPQRVVTREMTSIKFKKPVLKQVWSYIPQDVEEADAPDYILRALEFYRQSIAET